MDLKASTVSVSDRVLTAGSSGQLEQPDGHRAVNNLELLLRVLRLQKVQPQERNIVCELLDFQDVG